MPGHSTGMRFIWNRPAAEFLKFFREMAQLRELGAEFGDEYAKDEGESFDYDQYRGRESRVPSLPKPKVISLSRVFRPPLVPKSPRPSEALSLKKNEEAIVDDLLSTDLSRFLEESAWIGAVSQEVEEHLNTIDPKAVPRPLQVRYILSHVYEAVEKNSKLYERFLKVLGKHVPAKVLRRVRESYVLLTCGGVICAGEKILLPVSQLSM